MNKGSAQVIIVGIVALLIGISGATLFFLTKSNHNGVEPIPPRGYEKSIPSPTPSPTPNPVEEWKTFMEKYSIKLNLPSNMIAKKVSEKSISIYKDNTPLGRRDNIIYISVIPNNYDGSDTEIAGYNSEFANKLLNLQIRETVSLDELNSYGNQYFTYERLPDTQIGTQLAKTFVSNRVWEAPPEVKEIKYFIQLNNYTYLITALIESNSAYRISESELNQILSTFEFLE